HIPSLYSPTDSPSHLANATAENKEKVRESISELMGQGGTNHLAALEMAFRLKPDVIFLLTDGEAKDDISEHDFRRLSALNKGGAVINVIQFAMQARPYNTMERLATENRGQHVFINVTKAGELARKLPSKQQLGKQTLP